MQVVLATHRCHGEYRKVAECGTPPGLVWSTKVVTVDGSVVSGKDYSSRVRAFV